MPLLLRSIARGTCAAAAVALIAAPGAPAAAPSGVGLTVDRASISGRTLTVQVAATRSLRVRFAVVRGLRSTRVRASAARTVAKGTRTLRVLLDARPTGRPLRLKVTATTTVKDRRKRRSGSAYYVLPFRRVKAPVGGTGTPPPPTPEPGAVPPPARTGAPPTTSTTPTTTPTPPPGDVPPSVTTSGGVTTITEGAPATPIDPAVEVADDGEQLLGATARITTGADAGDTLGVTAPPGVAAAYDAATRTLTLSGAAPRAAYRDALRSITFQGTSDTPTAAKRVTLDVRDAAATSAPANKDLRITPVDDPRRAVDDAATVPEDAGATALDVLANDLDPDGGSPAPTIVSASDPARGTVNAAAGTSLTYRPDPGTCGPDVFTYTITGGATATVRITVTCRNDPPVLTAGGTLTYTENAPPAPVHPGLTVTDPDSLIQGARVSFALGGLPEDLLSWADNDPSDPITLDTAQSTVSRVVLRGNATPAQYQAALRAVTYADVSDAPSTTTRTVGLSVTDTDAATGNATRNVTVVPVDDAPTAVNDARTVLEDAAATVFDVLANDADPDGGPRSVASVTAAGHGTTAPVAGGVRYTPNPNFCGPDAFTYTLNGGSTATVNVTVTCVNDAPVADDEVAPVAIGATTLVLDRPGAGAPPAPGHPHRLATLDVLAGDSDVDSATLSVVPATNQATDDGGSVDVEADGDIVVRAAPSSCTDRTDRFSYRVTDGQAEDSGSVTLAYAGCVRYVSNSASGNAGTSSAPFDTLAQAEAASSAGDTVFVFTGDGTTTGLGGDGYALAAGERLIGQPAGLTVDPDGGGAQPPVTLAAPSSAPRPVLAATGADVVSLDDANEVRGLLLDPQGAGGGIAGGLGDTSGTIADVAMRDQGTTGTQPGLELDGTSGTWTVQRAAFGTIGATGVRLQNAGTVDLDDVRIDTVGARGLDAAATNLASSTFTSIVVNGSPNGAVRLASTTGTVALGDGVGEDLGLQTTAGSAPALELTDAAGVTVDAAGTDTVTAAGGPALRLSARPAALALDSLTSAGSAGSGIVLDGAGAATVTIAGGSVGGAAGAAVSVTGGSGTFTYNGSIGDGPGLSAQVAGRTGGTVTLGGAIDDGTDAGGGVVVTNGSGGTTAFTGTTKRLQTGALPAVQLVNNAGHAIVFLNGGLQLTTTTARGFDATGGGAVVVGGTNNTIDSVTGGALRVAGTTIGAGRLTFRRLASAGAVNGVLLQGTGDSGLSVTGAGGTCTSAATCTGGAIRGSTGDGVLLTDAADVALSSILIDGGAASAIDGTRVRDLRLTGLLADDNGNDASDVGIDLHDLTGTSTWTGVRVTRSELANVRIDNQAGTAALVVTGSDFSQLGTAFGANAFLLNAHGSAVVTSARIEGSTFTQNGLARGLTVQAQDDARIGTTATPLVVRTSAFTQNGLHTSFEQAGTGQLVFRLTESTLNGAAPSHAVNVFSSSAATGGSIRGRVQGNTIGTTGVAGSGSTTGNGIRALIQGATTARLALVGNTVRQTPQARGIDVQLLGPTTAAGAPPAEVTVQDNVVTPNDASGFPLAAIYLGADSQGGGPGLGRFDVRRNTVPAGASTDALSAFLVVDEVTAAAACEVVHDGAPSASASAELQSTNTGSAAASPACTQVPGPLEVVP